MIMRIISLLPKQILPQGWLQLKEPKEPISHPYLFSTFADIENYRGILTPINPLSLIKSPVNSMPPSSSITSSLNLNTFKVN
jgi:hypothetical protein